MNRIELQDQINQSYISPQLREVLMEKLWKVRLPNIEQEAIDILHLAEDEVYFYKAYCLELIQLLTTSQAQGMFDQSRMTEVAEMLEMLNGG